MSVYFIAEAGVNHNGSLDMALALVDVAAQAGADAVKFQTFSADALVTPSAQKAQYQKDSTGQGSQYDMLKQLELTPQMHLALIERCVQRGIEFLSTPFDEEALRMLVGMGMKRVKIPSGEITHMQFLKAIANTGLPMVLSTGMSTLDEVERAMGWIADERRVCGYTEPLSNVLTVLHCTSNYPAREEDIHLRALTAMAQRLQVPIGYSDHSLGLGVSTAAVALGARLIEKHFTLDTNLPGPDHRASLDPDGLKHLVAQIRQVERALGETQKAVNPSELPVRAVARRSVTLARAVSKGHVLTQADLCIRRPGTGIEPFDVDRVCGCVLKQDLPAFHTLMWTDLEA